MTTHAQVTEGFSSENSTHYQVTDGFETSTPWITRMLEELEKHNAGGYTLIDYRYIQPGLADHTLMDDLVARLEQ